ncbi:MAG TPA: hypothetical protein VJB57_02865 [Dehalococcoidia bacterium]|nr:hypothetical protein [Dehalococcoidia bacterium]
MADAPFMYWVGMNTAADVSPEELAKFNDFYSNVHMHEVVQSNPGFVGATRYELSEPDPRGDFGPRWLAMYEMENEAAAKGYIARNDGPPEGRPKYTPGPDAWQHTQSWWRLIWQRYAPKTGELGAHAAPYLYFVAMNVPPDTDEKGLSEFNDFYTNIHVPEVVAASNFQRGHRYELYREFLHPAPGSPRFLAVYDCAEEGMKTRAERRANPGSGPRLSSGPPTWEAHDTLWRLLYRRIDSWVKP